MATKPTTTFSPKGGPFSKTFDLYPDHIEHRGESHPLTGVTAEIAASGGTTTGYRGITISGPDFGWSVRIANTREGKAHKFAAAVNLAARQHTT